MTIMNLNRNRVVAQEVKYCRTVWSRLRGWLGRKNPPTVGQGLYLTPCQGVHTLGMRFSVDVVFIDKQGMVLRTLTLQPWRLSPFLPAARGVLELPVGTCEQGVCEPGDQLSLANQEGW